MVPNPSNQTMGDIGAELHDINSNLSNKHSTKNDKKNKFESLEEFSRLFILNASAKSINLQISSLSNAFTELLECSSTSRARIGVK